MTKYFTPIDLPDVEPEKKTADESVENWPSKELWSTVNDEIAKEINNITNGTSKFTSRGIQLRNNEAVLVTFRKFKESPTKENLDTFLKLAEQDLGSGPAKAFREWCNIIIKGDAK